MAVIIRNIIELRKNFMNVTRFTFHILTVFFILLLFAFLSETSSYAQELEIQIENNLRKEHPRLMFTKEDQLRIESLAKQDTLLQKLLDELFVHADLFLSEPAIKFDLEGSPRPRLLFQSRACLTKILTLGTAYRLSGDTSYARRAIKEMHIAAGFPDWNPSHFLDVAEMGTALAIGYDWLFDILSPNDREIIRTAILKHALEPGLSVHPDRFRSKTNNWNLICNGGLVITALAIADEEPIIAERIIRKAVKSLPNALKNYAPDGAWFEGPAYWMSATNYLSMMLSSMWSALGTDYGLSKSSGLENTGRFFIDAIGPTGDFFNYADGGKDLYTTPPALLCLAQLYNEPLLAWYNHQLVDSFLPIIKKTDSEGNHKLYNHRLFALEIIWFTPATKPNRNVLPLNTFYRGLTDVAFFRSSWEKDALWVGFKTGKNSVNHAHLDCGTFVFELGGHRWAEDLGDDDYNLPGYFERNSDSGRRWNYFRTSSLSHNVPVINNQNQRFNSDTKIIAFESNPKSAQVVADLSTAYEGLAESVKRGLSIFDQNTLLIQDEVVALKQGDQFRWAMLTSAAITVNSNLAELQIDDDTLTVEILQPSDAIFDTVSTISTYHPNETPNPGTRLLTISMPLEKNKINTIAVVLRGNSLTLQNKNIKVIPLSEWSGYLYGNRSEIDEKN
jgi:hypothetical protein